MWRAASSLTWSGRCRTARGKRPSQEPTKTNVRRADLIAEIRSGEARLLTRLASGPLTGTSDRQLLDKKPGWVFAATACRRRSHERRSRPRISRLVGVAGSTSRHRCAITARRASRASSVPRSRARRSACGPSARERGRRPRCGPPWRSLKTHGGGRPVPRARRPARGGTALPACRAAVACVASPRPRRAGSATRIDRHPPRPVA
jgi:hypothetical protein